MLVHVQVEEAHMRREQEPEDGPAEDGGDDGASPPEEDGELVEIGRVVRAEKGRASGRGREGEERTAERTAE